YVGQVVRRRMRDVLRRDHGGGGADDAVELSAAGAAAAIAGPRTRAGGIGRAGTGAARGRSGARRPRRAAALVEGRPGAGLVLVGRRADIDRRQLGGCNILRVRERCVESENRGGEKNRAMPASAHFPKFALSRGNCLLRTSESQGHWQ